MDKNYNDYNQETWLDDILGKPAESKQIDTDEQAAVAAGLTHPDDLELERIVQETLAENWGNKPTETKETADDVDGTRFFTSQRDTEQPAPEIETPVQPAPKRKLRPKAKKGYGLLGIPHILATVIWLALIVVIGVTMGRTVWVCAADLLALGKTPQEITVTVDEGDDITEIAEKLQKAGMIRYAKLFETFASLTGKGDNILAGSITFSDKTVYDYNALINAMSYRGGSTVTVEVMVPEGYSCAQIFELLEEKGVCSVSDLEEYAANGELSSYWFLDGVARGHKYCLEGFLFPDTYEFYMDDEPGRVLEKFLDDFEYRFTNRMVDKFVALNQKLGNRKLTILELVTMASMIEKEKANNLEGYTISSVYYNRLTNPASFPFLNCDATILYATEYYNKGELITNSQINDSPYNTYTQQGLPPGPIANPGLASLDAALEPEDTNYHYYVLNKAANYHVFSSTYEEHQRKMRELGY